MKSNEQQLIDIMFQTGLIIHDSPILQDMNREEVCEYIADQLRMRGFDTQPCGLSWGVLKNGS